MIAHLGKKLPVGDVFLSVGKPKSKLTTTDSQNKPELRPRKAGDKDYFTKGKRRYYCEVLAIVETRVRRIWFAPQNPSLNTPISSYLAGDYTKTWQFTYLVRILEN